MYCGLKKCYTEIATLVKLSLKTRRSSTNENTKSPNYYWHYLWKYPDYFCKPNKWVILMVWGAICYKGFVCNLRESKFFGHAVLHKSTQEWTFASCYRCIRRHMDGPAGQCLYKCSFEFSKLDSCYPFGCPRVTWSIAWPQCGRNWVGRACRKNFTLVLYR